MDHLSTLSLFEGEYLINTFAKGRSGIFTRKNFEGTPETILGYDLFGPIQDALSFGRRKKRRFFGREAVLDPAVPEPAVPKENPRERFLQAYSVPGGFPGAAETVVKAADEKSFRFLASMYGAVREDILRRVSDSGWNIYVMEQGKTWPVFEGLSAENSALPGAYVIGQNAAYIYKEILGAQNFENLPYVLLAHAYDRALGGDDFASVKSPAVQSLFSACMQKKPNHQFMSGYSEAGPVQYFAQSMASFLTRDSRLWGKQTLKFLDVCMYEYLGCLLGEP